MKWLKLRENDLAQSELSRALLSFGKGRDKRAASIQKLSNLMV